MWYVTLAVVATLMVAVVLANTDLFLTKSVTASLEELGTADLQTTTGGEQNGNNTVYYEAQSSLLTLETAATS